jgi:hypothetical protein
MYCAAPWESGDDNTNDNWTDLKLFKSRYYYFTFYTSGVCACEGLHLAINGMWCG